jgi:hypothetical protein
VTHTPWNSPHCTCWNVSDHTLYSHVHPLYDFLLFGFLNKVPKGCKVGLDRNLKLVVEQCFYQQSRTFLWRDPSTVISMTCLPQWPQRLFLVASIALPRTITWQVLLEYAPHNENKNHNPRETVMLGHPLPSNTHTNSTSAKLEFSLGKEFVLYLNLFHSLASFMKASCQS